MTARSINIHVKTHVLFINLIALRKSDSLTNLISSDQNVHVLMYVFGARTFHKNHKSCT